MTDRFKNAVDALVYAFFNDTLAKGKCSACAVGNMIAHAHGKKVGKGLNPVIIREIVSKDGESFYLTNRHWGFAFSTSGGSQCVSEYELESIDFLYSIKPTGYSTSELMKIEFAFETSSLIHQSSYFEHTKSEIMQDQYNGLMAVLDVLCEIEGIEDPSEYKELFTIS